MGLRTEKNSERRYIQHQTGGGGIFKYKSPVGIWRHETGWTQQLHNCHRGEK